MNGMQRAVRFQDDHVFFVLGIAEIADRPESRRNLVAINAVGGGDADGAAQIFIVVSVECIGNRRGVMIGGRINVDSRATPGRRESCRRLALASI